MAGIAKSLSTHFSSFFFFLPQIDLVQQYIQVSLNFFYIAFLYVYTLF